MGQRVPRPPPWHDQLTTVGVTGTNGKTSTVAFVAAILERIASPVGRVTSIGAFVGDKLQAVPRAYAGLVATLRAVREAGGRFGVVEWASWSLAQGFVAAWPNHHGILTNVTRDHLDYHGTFAAYLDAKADLFRCLPEGGVAIINDDDPSADAIIDVLPAHVRLVRYGWSRRALAAAPPELRLLSAEVDRGGTTMTFQSGSGPPLSSRLKLLGEHFTLRKTRSLPSALPLLSICRSSSQRTPWPGSTSPRVDSSSSPMSLASCSTLHTRRTR
jgi:UDP-N-acetylmuramoyl-L-alanyl-D-glutamate--2,6-diaminopimelate ligase